MVIKVGIVGVTGYVGVELVRLLGQHPNVEAVRGVSRDHAGSRLDQVYPHLRGLLDLEIGPYEQAAELIAWADLVFTALPHGLSGAIAREAARQGKKVIDLAADFRLPDVALYEKWYGQPHGAPELLDEAVYGLPELFRAKIKGARLIANPGCYPTCSLLGLAPLLKKGLVEPDSVIIDAKSGVSGGGSTASTGNLFSECNENIKPYGVGKHRHTSEITYHASALAGVPLDVTFTPHLIPMTRGMLCTIYGELTRPLDTQELRQIYQECYAGEQFVTLVAENEWPQTNWVRGTNNCYLGVAALSSQRLIVVSVIDNLVKGAAGQAVQNLNILQGFPEETGLEQAGLYL